MVDPVHLDGSQGEGGGQILRSAASLATLLGRPFHIERIRAGRQNPGLRPQHAGILRFLAENTQGDLENGEVGATEVRFRPGTPRTGTYTHDIGTAGSITLFLQAVLPVFLLTRGTTELRIRGGTDVSHAPPIDWYQSVYIPYVAPLVRRLDLQVVRRGLYPKGGGEVHVRIENPDGPEVGDLEAIRAHVHERLGTSHSEPGPVTRTTIRSFATTELEDAEVAGRQADAAATLLRRHLLQVPQKEVAYEPARSIGSATVVLIEDAHGHRIGGDALGARGVRAEAVGHRAAEVALADQQAGATVDRHMADQVVPWVALGAGDVRVPRQTGHLETNIETCRAFLGPDAVRLDGHLLRHG